MQSELNNVMKLNFYDKLASDKIKINWNTNPIRMDLFLSFLIVSVERSHNHLGSDTGWTLLKNDELKLRISGGIVNGIELLDKLEYGKNLSNKYNNYVNPFYLFEIFTNEGKKFFLNYYKSDIDKIVSDQQNKIASLELSLTSSRKILDDIFAEIEQLNQLNNK